jgi:transcriptional regulator with XRE-family HTH domain
LKERVQVSANSKGIPLYKLEEAVGMARGSISKWDSISPSVDKVKAVAIYLGVTVDSLLVDEQKEVGA